MLFIWTLNAEKCIIFDTLHPIFSSEKKRAKFLENVTFHTKSVVSVGWKFAGHDQNCFSTLVCMLSAAANIFFFYFYCSLTTSKTALLLSTFFSFISNQQLCYSFKTHYNCLLCCFSSTIHHLALAQRLTQWTNSNCTYLKIHGLW